MSPWSAEVVERSERLVRYVVREGEGVLAFDRALELWVEEPAFRVFFDDLLRAAPFEALRWETPPLTAAGARRAFEFVLLDAPDLLGPPDREAFAEHFPECGSAAPADAVVDFGNLGGDAHLVVPCPSGADDDYAHLAAFLRSAPAAQRHALWRAVGAATRRRLGARPLWLSTAGGGVAWLHVRIDARPKYYTHAPYREWADDDPTGRGTTP